MAEPCKRLDSTLQLPSTLTDGVLTAQLSKSWLLNLLNAYDLKLCLLYALLADSCLTNIMPCSLNAAETDH